MVGEGRRGLSVRVTIVAAAVGAVVLVGVLLADDRESAPPQRSGEGTASATPLSPAHVAQAKRIVADDERLAELLAGRTYEIKRMGPWTLSGSTEHIGALVDLELSEPLASERAVTLPSIDFDDQGRSYRERPWRVKILHADELTVLARFSAGRLVDIEPGVGSEVR